MFSVILSQVLVIAHEVSQNLEFLKRSSRKDLQVTPEILLDPEYLLPGELWDSSVL